MNDKVGNEPTDDEDKEPQQDQSSTNQLTPGAQLAARRQALDLSIEQVASHLNLAPRQIQAIESDNFSALPGMATARGFVRAYAKLLKVDATPLLEAIAKETADNDQAAPLRRALPATRFSESRVSTSSENRWLSRAVSFVILLVLVFGGLVITQQIGMHSLFPEFSRFGAGDESVQPASPPTQEMNNTPDGTLTSGDESAKVDQPAGEVTLGSPEAELSKRSERSPSDVAASGTASGTKQVPAESTAVAPPRNVAGNAKDMLTLTLREDSWVEIKRADNSIVVSSLLKAGTTESFRINGPVAITIGNAAGVDLTLRGKPVEMKADAKTNVARLNLK